MPDGVNHRANTPDYVYGEDSYRDYEQSLYDTSQHEEALEEKRRDKEEPYGFPIKPDSDFSSNYLNFSHVTFNDAVKEAVSLKGILFFAVAIGLPIYNGFWAYNVWNMIVYVPMALAAMHVVLPRTSAIFWRFIGFPVIAIGTLLICLWGSFGPRNHQGQPTRPAIHHVTHRSVKRK